MVVYESIHHIENFPPAGSCVALGLFDGLHAGHRDVIGAAVQSARRDNLTPAVFTFRLGQAVPARKPAAGRLLSSPRRNALVEAMGVTHLLCPPFDEFYQMQPADYVRDILHGTLRARWVCCGEDYRFGRHAAADVNDLRQLGAAYGIHVQTVPILMVDGQPLSSTRIRACVAEGDMVGAGRLLGRPFSIDFEVIAGRRLGRTLQYPTINQALPSDFIKPRFGVYVTVASVQGRRYAAVTNVGVKPTVGSDRVLAETCILDYEGDLYGQRILVEFYDFLRPEQQFNSLQALREQIRDDAETARHRAADWL